MSNRNHGSRRWLEFKFGDELDRLKNKAGFKTWTALAEASGVSNATLNRIKKGSVERLGKVFREEQLPQIIKALIWGNTARGITSLDEVKALLKMLPRYAHLEVEEEAWVIQEAEKELEAVVEADLEQALSVIENTPSREGTGQAIEYVPAGIASVDAEELKERLEKAIQFNEASARELKYIKQMLFL